MFRLSAKGDYGLMFLQSLAKLPKDKYLGLSEVASRYKLPLKYLERLAHCLVEARIVVSREGKGGGYALAKKPNRTSLIQALQVLEGEFMPIVCSIGCGSCERQQACEKKTGWKKVHNKLYQTLSKFTLADLLK